MTIKFTLISGASTSIPGVYSDFQVGSGIVAPAAPARDIVLLGEADEGVPGADLDLRGLFFTDFEALKEYFKSGPMVDAGRAVFSSNPSPVFSGSVNRVYCYKTNSSTRASKTISSPSGYGSIVATRYGEAGNLIKSQIKTGQAESKPSKTVQYLPSPASRDFRVSVNGAVTDGLTVAADGVGSDFVTALTGITGLSVTGGTARTSIASGPMTADLTTTGGDVLVITRSSGSATFGSMTAGDVAYIPDGSALAGGADENAGAYAVVSATTTVLTLKRLKSASSSAEVNSAAFDVGAGVSIAAADLLVNAPVVLTVTATTASGAAASLEILEDSASKLGAGMLAADSDLANILVDSTSSVANVSASVPSSGKLTVGLSAGSWTSTPKAGDLIRISVGSLLAGATLKNVGLLMVESATAQSITCSHLFSGMTTEAVNSVALNGANDVLKHMAGFVSSSVAAKRIDSSAERKVQLSAIRVSDGLSFPSTLIGGSVALELGYYAGAATACTVSINAQRVMTITPTGTGLSAITVNTRKYATLQELVDFLNTQANLSARIPDARMKSLPTSVLDMVTSVGILSGQAVSAYNGKLKKDYYDWKKFLADNLGLVAFAEGAMTLKSGLPDAESTAGFLSGGAVGSTSNASVQAGLDAALQVDVAVVIPLFSRDASKDIDDALTDTSSTYTIDSVNAALRAHVATASSSEFKKERFGMASFDGSFTDAQQKAADLSYERIQMAFQRVRATAADGTLKTFLPWMEACVVAAGRMQAALGASMLRKPFLLSDATHVGDLSLYTDTLLQDFNPDDRGELEGAIDAGLLVLRAVPGFGVRMESPDCTTRSRENSPDAWVYERANVLFTCDSVIKTLRNTLENFIGNRTSDTPTAVVKSACESVLLTFVQSGALLGAQVLDVKSLGNQYTAKIKVTPGEALESLNLSVIAERSV